MSNVKVSVRVRPTANFAQDQLKIDQDTNSIYVHMSAHGDDDGDGHNSANKTDSYQFSYHNVLHNAGQDTCYESNTAKVVGGVLDGRNGTVMAYGQTGAGKTFTMIGSLGTYHQRGIQPRALAHVFREIENRTEYEFKVSVSYMELYNERIFDLLSVDQRDQSAYSIVEDKRHGKGTHVRGLVVRECNSEKDALNCLFEGAEKRTTAQHILNTTSNRSHCIFTVYITQRSRLASSDKVIHSKLNLVDLAGSERLKKVDREDPITGERSLDSTIRRESMYINKSLTYLEQVVVALTTKNRHHIPYRQTKLTNVLKDSLGGNSNTLMVACVYGEARHIEETLSTLRLAQRMMRVENKSEEVITIDPLRRIKQLEMMNKSLKQELMMHDALSERSGVTYDEYTPEQRHAVATTVRKYLDAPPEEEESIIQIESIRHVVEIFRAFKLVVKNVESQTMEKLRNQFTLSAKGANNDAMAGARAGSSVGDGGEDEGGEIEDGGGYGVGVAPNQARPDSIDLGDSPEKDGRSPPQSPEARGRPGSPGSPGGGVRKAIKFDDKNSAFNVYKMKAGNEANEALIAKKTSLVQVKARARTLRTDLNRLKAQIDEYKALLAQKRSSTRAIDASKTTDEDEVVDAEEFDLMKREQAAKREYRANFAQLKQYRMDIDQYTREAAQMRGVLVQNFNDWYATATGEDLEDPTKNTKNDDRMDEGEMFEKMEIDRVMEEDPDSVSFFLAQKNLDKTRRKDHGRTARSIRSKRLHK
jgi:kinesin family member 6/9